MNKEYLDTTFSTSNLSLAATLTLFFSLQELDRSNERKINFVFPRQEALEELVEAFWRGEVNVEPQAYFNSLKSLKTRIYERP